MFLIIWITMLYASMVRTKSHNMKKYILSVLTVSWGLFMLYMSHFQRDYFLNNNVIMSFGIILTLILVFLHIKLYKK